DRTALLTDGLSPRGDRGLTLGRDRRGMVTYRSQAHERRDCARGSYLADDRRCPALATGRNAGLGLRQTWHRFFGLEQDQHGAGREACASGVRDGALGPARFAPHVFYPFA